MHSQALSDSHALQVAWGIAAPARHGPRARYTVGEVVDIAVLLADGGGLASVSLAALAAELGLTTTALYRYVDSKESLVGLMADAAMGPPPRLAGRDWRARTQGWARQLKDRYAAHPWLATVQPEWLPRHPHRLAWLDLLLTELDVGGVRDPARTALLLDGLARTFSLLAQAPTGDPAVPDWLVEIIRVRHPRVARELARRRRGLDRELVAAVDTLLNDGGHSRRPQPVPRRPRAGMSAGSV